MLEGEVGKGCDQNILWVYMKLSKRQLKFIWKNVFSFLIPRVSAGFSYTFPHVFINTSSMVPFLQCLKVSHVLIKLQLRSESEHYSVTVFLRIVGAWKKAFSFPLAAIR